MRGERETQILAIAEEMVRQGGYASFSFRQIAKAVGIKSASVHYHFETKEELGVELTRYYRETFLRSLGDPKMLKASGLDPIVHYVNAFREALVQDKGMCMCGMLGAQAADLPERVVAELRLFFSKNMSWLEAAYQAKGETEERSKKNAIQAMSTLEGAMLLSNTMGEVSFFDIATESLVD